MNDAPQTTQVVLPSISILPMLRAHRRWVNSLESCVIPGLNG